ncbi:MAG: hypothetical protein U5O39_14100 [Gammaproteobacteria bacterium]|nr:hypothetical protein [Gammaproteobacteria bacterium]
MYKFMKFMRLGSHLSPMMFGTMDPMVLELIREERFQQAEQSHAEELAEARKFAAQDDEDTRKAA